MRLVLVGIDVFLGKFADKDTSQHSNENRICEAHQSRDQRCNVLNRYQGNKKRDRNNPCNSESPEFCGQNSSTERTKGVPPDTNIDYPVFQNLEETYVRRLEDVSEKDSPLFYTTASSLAPNRDPRTLVP